MVAGRWTNLYYGSTPQVNCGRVLEIRGGPGLAFSVACSSNFFQTAFVLVLARTYCIFGYANTGLAKRPKFRIENSLQFVSMCKFEPKFGGQLLVCNWSK